MPRTVICSKPHHSHVMSEIMCLVDHATSAAPAGWIRRHQAALPDIAPSVRARLLARKSSQTSFAACQMPA